MATSNYISVGIHTRRQARAVRTPKSVSSAALVRWYARGRVGLWKDAARTQAAVADGDAVAVWDDQAGQTAATQATLAKRLILRTLGGEWLLEGDGARIAVIGDLSALAAATVMISLKVKTVPPTSAKSGLWDLSGISDDTHYTWTDGGIYEGAGTTVRKALGAPAQDLTVLHIYSIISKNNDWRAYHNGALLHTSLSNTVSFRSTARIGVSKSGLYFLDGFIKEFVLFDGELSENDFAAMHAYMAGSGVPPL